MNDSVVKQIADLPNLSYGELKQLWQALYGTEAPVFSKPCIIKRLAYRIQELTYGGLSARARAFMQSVLIANGFDDNGCKPESTRAKLLQAGGDVPVLGTKLSRDWNGHRHEVTVVHGGFEYEGIRYRSLTAATKAITGTHWNGRKFFGLKATKGGER